MAILHDPYSLTVTEAAKRGLPRLVADAEAGQDLLVTRRAEPVAAVLSVQRLREVEELLVDLQDLAVVLARVATDNQRRTSFDDVLDAFGHTPASLAALPDD
jgi:prevent-host-death family protein